MRSLGLKLDKNVYDDIQAISRFWPKVCKTATCWFWTSNKTRGYGLFKFRNKSIYAHIFAFAIEQEVLETEEILHHCDNKGCVRFDHLHKGDQSLNLIEASIRGLTGTLTSEQILEIRRLYDINAHTQLQLANIFNVNQSTISRIINLERRQYVTTL